MTQEQQKERFLKYIEIAKRAEQEGIYTGQRFTLVMDIENADKAFRLRLDELLAASSSEFAHDILGITNNIVRREFDTPDFGDFTPRFAGNYTREQLLDILERYGRLIQRNKEFPTVLLDDLEKSIYSVLKTNGRAIKAEKGYFAILQVPCTDEMHRIVFEPYERLRKYVGEPNPDHYQMVYKGDLPAFKNADALLERLYMKFNLDKPSDYHARSLSVSDVVVLSVDGKISCHYVDRVGYQKLDGFLDKDKLTVLEKAFMDGKKKVSLTDKIHDAKTESEKNYKSANNVVKDFDR